jgi:hypothetical protein
VIAGWSPTQRHVRVLDERGRFVGTEIQTEPEFNAEQVDLLLALAELERDMGPYGQPLSEAMSPGADLTGDHPTHWYVAKGPEVNYAERAADEAREAYRAELGDRPMPKGLVWRVEKKTIT